MSPLCLRPSLCLISPSFLLVCLSSSSRPHPAVLPGFLLFLGRHVRPDHVGDAAHSGWLRAKVQRPRPHPRLVCLDGQCIELGRPGTVTGSTSLWAMHYSYLHQRDAVTIMCYITAAFCIDLFWSLILWDNMSAAGRRIACALVSLLGITYNVYFTLRLCCRAGDSTQHSGYRIQQIRAETVLSVRPTPGVLPAK